MELNTTNATKAAKDTFNGATKSVDKFADRAQSGLDQAIDKARSVESSLTDRYADLKDSASEGYDIAVNTVRKYPLYAVLGSTAIGLLAGLLLGRRKH